MTTKPNTTPPRLPRSLPTKRPPFFSLGRLLTYCAPGCQEWRQKQSRTANRSVQVLGRSRPIVLDHRRVGASRAPVMPDPQASEPTLADGALVGLPSLPEDGGDEAPPGIELPRYNRRSDEQ